MVVGSGPAPVAGSSQRSAGLALVLPTVDQVTLQPYQTTYVNLATDLLVGSRTDDMRPGGDYWRVSIPELVAHTALDRQLLCKATTTKDTDLAYPFANGGEAFSTSRSTDCREEANGPLAPDRLPVVRQLPATEYDAVFIGPLPRNCTPLDEVSRWRHGFDVVMTTLGRCTVDPAPLPVAGVRADDPVAGDDAPRRPLALRHRRVAAVAGPGAADPPGARGRARLPPRPGLRRGVHPGDRRVRPGRPRGQGRRRGGAGDPDRRRRTGAADHAKCRRRETCGSPSPAVPARHWR